MTCSTACLLLARAAPLAAVLVLAAAPQADARARRLPLSLPSSATAGARVQAAGRVQGASHGRRVVLQARSGKRWRALGSAAVMHGRFKVVFLAPNRPQVLTVRAVLYRRRHRIRISRSRKLVIRARPQAASPQAPSALQGANARGWGFNLHGQVGAGYRGEKILTAVPVVHVAAIKEIVATGGQDTALLADGTVVGWGGNLSGQLGDGTQEQKVNPVAVKGLAGPVTQIAAAAEHAIALLSNGTVETWGSNLAGELGNGTDGGETEACKEVRPAVCRSLVAVPVPGLSHVAAVFAGGADDAALLENGRVVVWGENKTGQLGDGTKTRHDTPFLVPGLSEVKTLAIGGIFTLGGHILALLKNGTVKAVGGNSLGQLGDGSTQNRLSYAPVAGLSGVTAVSASWTHSLALLGDGTVRAWGANNFGQIGTPTATQCGGQLHHEACAPLPVTVPLPRATAISAGFAFSLAISEGRVYSWGHNSYGQLGSGGEEEHRTRPGLVSGVSEATAISAGYTHAAALTNGPAARPTIEAVPGRRSLTINWEAAASPETWYLAYRPIEQPQAPWTSVKLEPKARTFTITGLQPRRYEVVVRQLHSAFGARIIEGTPS